MDQEKAEKLLEKISFPNYSFVLLTEDARLMLQARYYEPDVVTGERQLQKTRKWLISSYMTDSEFVQTAFKCLLTSAEHRTREHFLFEGERVYSPHYDVFALVELCRAGAFDERADRYAGEEKAAENPAGSDFQFCSNCRRICGVLDGPVCASCGEMICLHCGCKDSAACADVCSWARPGVCSNCDSEPEEKADADI